MNPFDTSTAFDASEPNVELLRRHGWAVGMIVGRYCVAWRGVEEAVFVWRESGWEQVPGRTAARAA